MGSQDDAAVRTQGRDEGGGGDGSGVEGGCCEARASEGPSPGGPGARRRPLSRRAFLGLGGAAALMLLAGSRMAWAGVGSGAWGDCGAVAYPGSHFGWDGGRGYSSNGCAWISVSCNASVGRMTELLVQFSVSSYYANGGAWTPTWSTDYADTHVDSFIRNSAGTWMSSASGFYDTTYDSWGYHGPYVTSSLVVRRETYDWWAWAGVRAWCDSNDSAYGINTVAEASQLVPRHFLVDDRSWQRRVVTLRPRSAEHLRADASAAGLGRGTNVLGWEPTDMTNQNWIVLTSSQGRTCFVPVHTGASPMFLDVAGGVWDDGANMQLCEGNGSLAQSYYLHDLGTGYHLIVPECSGCAVDLYDGYHNGVNGANIQQSNCFGSWENGNQNWKLEDVVFRERTDGAMALEGEACPGGVLAPGDPAEQCLPCSPAGTNGLVYRYTWFRGGEAGARDELVRASGEDSRYQVAQADADAFLTCVVTAHTRYADVPYQGEVAVSSPRVRSLRARVRFHADGEPDACFADETDRDAPYRVPPAAFEAAAKPECAGLDAWYRDAACTLPFEDGSVVEDDLELHARNRVDLVYAHAERSCLADRRRSYFCDKDLENPLEDASAVLPAAEGRFHGERAAFARGPSAWYEDGGRVREASCALGAYATADAVGAPLRSARLTRNTTAYLLWEVPSYDGISVS